MSCRVHLPQEWTEKLCIYCLSRSGTTRDHILPKSRGGSDDLRNLVYACPVCNSAKGHRISHRWLEKLSVSKIREALDAIEKPSSYYAERGQIKFRRIANLVIADLESREPFGPDITVNPIFAKREPILS